MKILHIINSMGMGGAQSLLVELCPVQREMGHEVTVLQLVDAKDHTLVDKLTAKGVAVHALAPAGRSVRTLCHIARLRPWLRRCDVAHVHLFPSQYWAAAAAMLLCRRRRPVLVTTEHSTQNKRRNKPIFKWIDTFFYRRYASVVACADKARETFLAHYPGVECVAIPNGVDISKYTAAEPYDKQQLARLAADTFATVMVARFGYPKRQDMLVEALAQLPPRHHAVLVGGRPSDEGVKRVSELAAALGVADRVHFLYLRPDVPRILKSADAVVMLSEYEGLSLSSIEGMASGRPFLATNVNGLREVVSGAGMLIPCGDAAALATALLRLEGDAAHRAEVVARCLARAAEFDIHTVAEKYVNEYGKHLHANG